MFDPQSTAAGWYLGDLNAEDLPTFACQALEQGHEGPNLRRLAGLLRPTKRDVDGIIDGALRELGVAVPLSKEAAVLWTLDAVKSSAGSTEITAPNLTGNLLIALPELENAYLERLKWYCGRPGNYEVIFHCLRPALEADIAEGVTTDFLRRSCSFIEQVCNSGDPEAINVLWIEIFEWLAHSPSGELRFLWPTLGPLTREKIREVLRRMETENLL